MRNRIFKIVALFSSIYIIWACKPHDSISPNEPKPLHKVSDSLLVDGYFNKFAFFQGEKATVFFNSKTNVDSVYFGIYDVNEEIVGEIYCKPIIQKIQNSLPYQNGFGYINPKVFLIDKNLKSGLYFIGKKIPFLVKNNSINKADFVVVHPNHTDIAYNDNGGMSLYLPSHQNRARILSLARPHKFGANGNPIPFYKWLLLKKYNVDFISDDELQSYDNFNKYKLMVIAGHSEYWTRAARENFDKFINSGNNALLLTGNTMYWQIRIDTLKGQFICYKYDAYTNDPTTDIKLKTSRWEDTQLGYNPNISIGTNFLFGGGYEGYRQKDSTGFGGYRIIHPEFDIYSGLNLKINDAIQHDAIEYDGMTVNFKELPIYGKTPFYDNSKTKLYKVDILGWDYARPDNGLTNGHYKMPNGLYNIALQLILKPKVNSGLIINISSSNWCNVILNKSQLQTITVNSIGFLLKNNDYTLKEIKN